MKSRVIGIFLFLCLAAPFGATYLWLHYSKIILKKEVKRQIIAGLGRDELILLKFTKEDSATRLRWNNPMEFEFDHQLYDIVETEFKGETTDYWCWLDHKETNLDKKLDKILAKALGNDPQKKEYQKRLNTIFKSLYYSKTTNFLKVTNFSTWEFNTYTTIYHSVSFPPPVPPPKIG